MYDNPIKLNPTIINKPEILTNNPIKNNTDTITDLDLASATFYNNKNQSPFQL